MTPETPNTTARHVGLAARLRLGFFRALAGGVRTVGEQPPGRLLRRRLLRSVDYTHKGVRVADGTFEGLSVAFLTDIHAGHLLSADDLVEVFDRVAAQRPDVVCFGGDLVDTRAVDLHVLERPLSRLRPRLGAYVVPGNHEHQVFRDIRRFYDFLERYGVSALHNRGLRLELGGSSLWLAGVDDLTMGRPDLEAALSGRREGEPTLLLSHHPDLFVQAARHGVDLQLSGHTHGGQISLLGWKPFRHTRRGFLEGMHWSGKSALYVSRGVGVTALPFRVAVRAEVPLLELRGEPVPERAERRRRGEVGVVEG